MFSSKSLLVVLTLSLCCIKVLAFDAIELTVEEQRIEKARLLMPDVVNRFNDNIATFKAQLAAATNSASLTAFVLQQGESLWTTGILSYAKLNDFDDRPLYWARLQSTQALRQAPVFKSLSASQQENLLWQFELFSRGQQDVKFDKNSTKKILVTGFDPFFLDQHLDQSNPSGAVAMAVDDLLLGSEGQTIEIESLIIPVRYEDFDKGMIEKLLTPYLKNNSVDMIITISMGRDNFDLERFPGLRRSAKAPDNLNVFTGASPENPLVPRLKNGPLKGPEFIEFSLPAQRMLKAQGTFTINDNHKVTTLEKSFNPKTIDELSNQVSVQGSGGGYLSNEISYRSLLVRDKYNSTLAVGHIHTPRFKAFEPQKTEKIIQQIKAMISLAAAEL